MSPLLSRMYHDEIHILQRLLYSLHLYIFNESICYLLEKGKTQTMQIQFVALLRTFLLMMSPEIRYKCGSSVVEKA